MSQTEAAERGLPHKSLSLGLRTNSYTSSAVSGFQKKLAPSMAFRVQEAGQVLSEVSSHWEPRGLPFVQNYRRQNQDVCLLCRLIGISFFVPVACWAYCVLTLEKADTPKTSRPSKTVEPRRAFKSCVVLKRILINLPNPAVSSCRGVNILWKGQVPMQGCLSDSSQKGPSVTRQRGT